MKTSEVLDLAADKIEERGWATGPEAWEYGGSSPLCLEGGIQAALGKQSWFDRESLWSCPAYQAVQSYLGDRLVYVNPVGTEYPADRLWEFNDSTGRTKEEVIEVLRAAAAVERVKEATEEATASELSIEFDYSKKVTA